MFSEEQIAQLSAPLDRAIVSTRSAGSGRPALSYITAHHARNEANRIFGFGNWNSRVIELKPVVEPKGERNFTNQKNEKGYLVAYTCTVSVTVESSDREVLGQTHQGVGYGEGIDYGNPGKAYESAVKEAESDALKRALINWGNPFGLALYDKDQSEVVGEAPSRSVFGKDK